MLSLIIITLIQFNTYLIISKTLIFVHTVSINLLSSTDDAHGNKRISTLLITCGGAKARKLTSHSALSISTFRSDWMDACLLSPPDEIYLHGLKLEKSGQV